MRRLVVLAALAASGRRARYLWVRDREVDDHSLLLGRSALRQRLRTDAWRWTPPFAGWFTFTAKVVLFGAGGRLVSASAQRSTTLVVK